MMIQKKFNFLEEGDGRRNLWIVFPFFASHDVAEL